MKRVATACVLATVTMALIWGALLFAAFYAPRQIFIDYFLDADTGGKDQKLIDFLISDLRDMLQQMSTAMAGAVLLASLLWLFRSSRAEIAVPGQASGYRWSWSGIAMAGGAVAVTFAALLCFSGVYFEILRLETRWALTAVALPLCWFIYWLVTAMWTPSLQAPAVLLSGWFRWLRRPLFL